MNGRVELAPRASTVTLPACDCGVDLVRRGRTLIHVMAQTMGHPT